MTINNNEKSPLELGIHRFLEIYHPKDIETLQNQETKGTLYIDHYEIESFLQDHLSTPLTYDILKDVQNFSEHHINKESQAKITVRLVDAPHNVSIHDLDTDHVGKFISTAAMIKNITPIKAKINRASFECRGCMAMSFLEQKPGESIIEPALCISCGSRSFRLLPEQCEFINYRYLKLEEPLELRRFGGTREFIAYMEDDLANPNSNIKPGDVVDITGRFEVIQDENNKEWKFLINTHNITSLNSSFEDVNIDDEDKNTILELSEEKEIFDKLVSSIAPNIHGHRDVKEGIVLQLFEGNRPHEDNIHDDRWVIHILIIGDPGIGKSELVKEISKKAPKGIYVSGTGSTEAGLTASAVKDELTGKWAMEAGAIVLADSGILTIDEFDKLKKNTMKSLNEPMEQLTVSTAKAGLVQTMTARTSVLAAANPKYSKFDSYKNIKEQINIPESTLSRFDLVYALEDIVDQKKDQELAFKILNNTVEKEDQDIIEAELLQKYIAYAKSEIHPVLTDEASQAIANFYVDTRQASVGNEDSKPITPRDMKAIQRLSIARAKVELREYVTLLDAECAIQIFRDALKTVGLEPDTAGGLRGVRSDKEIQLIKFVESRIKEVKALYGDDLPAQAVNDIKAELSGMVDGRVDTVEAVYKEAWSNIKGTVE